MKYSKILTAILVGLLVVSCSANSDPKVESCLSTQTEYQFCVTPELITQLSSEEMKATDGDFQKEVFEYGAISAATIYYTDLATQQEHDLISVFLFPADKFDSAANPNEPPRFGQEVIRTDGKVLSIAGPQDSMFDPASQDGMNINVLYELMYEAQSWQK